MTAKQDRIVKAALQLFAKHGFDGTSTIKIAKKAEVSEGLIFKHFKNKQGLLNHLIDDLQERIDKNFGFILKEKDPKQILKKAIDAVFDVPKSEYTTWRLQYMLKMDKKYYDPNQVKPFIEHAAFAFKALDYKNPMHEAFLFHEILDSLFLSLIRGNIENKQQFKKFLLDKYQLKEATV